ncbi:MAG: phage holin family protein [Dysgonomonas sp.]
MEIELNFQHLFVVCVVLLSEYMLVLMAVLADLIAGCRKAKKRGELRSSYGFRKTVDKLGRYYLPLFALTIVDMMQLIVVWYLNEFYGYTIPLLPVVSLIGSLGIGLIEVKSILEKAEDKVKFERVGELAGSVIQNKGDAAAIIAELVKYLKEENQDGKN